MKIIEWLCLSAMWGIMKLVILCSGIAFVVVASICYALDVVYNKLYHVDMKLCFMYNMLTQKLQDMEGSDLP